MKNIAIFASGSGTNAENIVNVFHRGSQVRVAVVLVNKKDAGVRDRMARLGVPTIYVPNSVWADNPQEVVDMLKPYHPELIVLAGFLRPVKKPILDAYPGRIINIHPSLLPAHGGPGMYGMKVHEDVVKCGETKSGATVHFVSEEIDGGEIIMQQEVELSPDDSPEQVAQKVHGVEYSLFPRAIVAAFSRMDRLSQAPAVPDTPEVPVVPDVPVTPEVPATPEVPQDDISREDVAPAAPASTDEEWAEVLKIKYSDREAEKAAARVAAQHPAPAPAPARPNPQIYASAPEASQPKSYLWVSILVTVLCCTLFGIIAIVFSAQVGTRLSMGDLQGAERASRRAQTWIIVSFVVGVLWSTLIYPIYIFGSLLV